MTSPSEAGPGATRATGVRSTATHRLTAVDIGLRISVMGTICR
jgi:hypothetical protein